ncbi:uncharacterized protein LOC110103473 isoform X1 [Dendrobium catenatum]|uniref:Uncharacterized protein n=1 Tax=Dendrobium catenatum TaxID=906689 RepID=A0A2I0VQF3_9ASPA|nr:uncharacterized protein LOC110103473 isoform X1 [Dendrobium catenatum]PKU65637.1 hypothetical protein MA16_Dca022977 [Dendrobium catenatum]
MAISSSCFSLEEAMDKIWFHNNILFFQPSNLNILSMLQKDGNILKSTTSSEGSSFYESVVNEIKNKKIVQKMKNPEGLSSPTNKICSKEEIPQPTLQGTPKIRRSQWSLYELKGFNDLGFLSRKEKVGDRERKFEESKVEEVKRPYLSDAWFINRADFSLLDLRMLPKTIEGTYMKKYLRSWAHNVASLVCYE